MSLGFLRDNHDLYNVDMRQDVFNFLPLLLLIIINIIITNVLPIIALAVNGLCVFETCTTTLATQRQQWLLANLTERDETTDGNQVDEAAV